MTNPARELHDAFDRDFAAALPPPAPAHGDFLCVRVAGEPCALALGVIASLHAGLRVIALPTRAPALLGVAAIRAAIVPIYDLGAAFGAAGGGGALRWIVVLRGGQAGFAFQGFDGHARIPERAIALAAQPGHLAGQFVLGDQPRSIIDLASVLAAIETQRARVGPVKDP